MSKRRLPRKVRVALNEAFKNAKLELCALDVPEDVRNYLSSWVVPPLENVLKWDRGEKAFLDGKWSR